MNPKTKNEPLCISVIAVGILVLLAVGGIWPVLLLAPVCLCGYGVVKLMSCRKQPEEPAEQEIPPQNPEPVTEQQLQREAFGLLQRRITERVTGQYPDARWIWGNPNAYARFIAGEPLEIMLNGAGGYNTFDVAVRNLQFMGLTNRATQTPVEQHRQENDDPDPEPVDYGLLAFEWVDANLSRLTATEDCAFRIPAEELPHGDSWPAVCEELLRSGFASAVPVADGIRVTKEGSK